MDLNEMMAQAKEIQSRVGAVQESLGDVRVKGLAGNGAVIVEMTGKYDIVNVILADDITNKSATEIAALVKDAFMDAKQKADVIIDKAMNAATAGIDLPF